MSDQITRRQFLKIAGAGFGAVAAASVVGPALSKRKRSQTQASAFDDPFSHATLVPTFCEMCFWQCSVRAFVVEGEVRKLEGHPDDPLSRGRLCPRGTGGIGALYDPDRLRTPLLRISERGTERFKEVDWPEALDYVAEKLETIRKQYGPQAVGLFSHGHGASFFHHLIRAYGSPVQAAPSYAQCRGPRECGFQLTYGEPVGGPERTDIANTRFLVLIGSHLGENMHNTQVRELAEAVAKGVEICVVDPRFSTAAGKAKWWLPIRPGTDIALLLAWMNVIVTDGTYDKDYIHRYTYGFDQLKAELAEKTPEWAYVETGIRPEIIRATAREMARQAPATLVHPGRHVVWYGNDTQRSRAIAILNALLGSWGRKGGLFRPTMAAVPKYPSPPYPEQGLAADFLTEFRKLYPLADEITTAAVRDATITGKPYPVKGWFVYATNMLQSLPQPQKTIDAIQKLDFLVVIDTMPMEITGWADVVLPEATYLERYDDLRVGGLREPFIQLRQPVVEPLHNTKPGWWIAKQLAHRLGLDEFFPWHNIDELLEFRLRAAGTSLAAMKKTGILVGKPGRLYFGDGEEVRFATPTGKIELYSTTLARNGLDPIPTYTPPQDPLPGYFRLLFGRVPMHTFDRTTNNRLLGDLMAENEVWVNQAVADDLGLVTGDYVTVTNQDGAVTGPIRVKATQRIHPECVFMAHGFGHTAKRLRFAYGRGGSDNQLITRVQVDPAMGGTGMNVNFVMLRPAPAPAAEEG